MTTKSSKAGRKAISKKLRFEVFKRDSFKCQYCGKCAPDVILHVDHIDPVSNGGDNDMMNLITSCLDCNLGKSDVELSDDSAVKKQRAQLEELNQRREQLEMMLNWRDAMKEVGDMALEAVCDAWAAHAVTFHLNESGRKQAKLLLRRYPLADILEAMDVAAEKYLEEGDDGSYTRDSVSAAWVKVGGILKMKSLPDYMQRVYYARGILRKRIYVNERAVIGMMTRAIEGGADPDLVVEMAKTCRNWTEFSGAMAEWEQK